MTKLVCPECRRENEPERIYCHDCGARLDRSAVAKVKPAQEDPRATRRRLQSMLDPRRAKVRQLFFQASKVVLGAVAAAALVQMLRLPDLPPKQKNLLLPTQINLEMENAATDPQAGPLRYTDEQVNAYLANTLRTKQAALSHYYLNFERAVVDFEEGYFRVTAERSLFGWPLSTTAICTARIQDGAVVGENRGGSIGRLAVHPVLMQYGNFFFADLKTALERERKSLAKLGALEFHPDSVFITPKQAAPAPIQPGQ